MADYIKKIRTTTGDKEIDYEALVNKPSIPSVDESLLNQGDAADAKIVGEKFTQLDQEIEDINNKSYEKLDVVYNETNNSLVFQNTPELPNNVYVDKTLTESGNAADAKATGDAITELKNETSELKGDIGDLDREVMGYEYEYDVDVPTKYYKISFDEVWRSDRNAISGSASISEVCFLDVDGNTKTISSVVADSEYSSSYAALKVIDGDLSTMWSSKEVSDIVHTLEFSLVQPALITSIGIVPRPNMETGVPNNMTFYTSLDGIEWIEVGVVTNLKETWEAETWKYFDLQTLRGTEKETFPSIREEIRKEYVKTIVAETEHSEISVPSELPGIIEDASNSIAIYGNEEAVGVPCISDCENLMHYPYTLNRTTNFAGVVMSSYYRYLIINGDGTGTSNAYTYITGDPSVALPNDLKPGDTYRVIIFTNKELPSDNIRCCIEFQDKSKTKILMHTMKFKTDRQFTGTVPESTVYWRISFEGITANLIWDDVRIYPILIKNESRFERLSDTVLGINDIIDVPLKDYSTWGIINTFEYEHSYKYKIDAKTYIDNHISDVKMTYTTPEDFGAVGDGIFDDTISVRNCIDYAFANNIPARMCKTYLVSDSVKIKSGMDVYINSLIYTGYDSAILMDCARSNVYVGRLISNAKGVCLRADTIRVEYNLIRLGYVDCKRHCISLESTIKAIFQNKFEFRLLKSGGDGYNCITHYDVVPASYITENTYYGGQCTNADWTYYGTGGNNKFYDIQVEGNIKGGYCFINKADAFICGDRHAESMRDGEYPYIKIITPDDITSEISGLITGLKYISGYGLRINEIDVSEVKNYYISSNDGAKHSLESQGILGKIECSIMAYGRTGEIETEKYQKFAESALIWGNTLIFQGVPFKYFIVTENFDLRTIGETTPALPSAFEIGCENCEIHLHPTYCFMGINKFEVIQTETYQATIYDYFSNSVVFDGTQYGAGTFEVSTYLNGDFARIDGTNMIWKVRRIE